MSAAIPSAWLEQLALPYQRDLLVEGFGRNLPITELKTEPIFINFQLTWEVEDWLEKTVLRYGHPAEEIIEITVQLGRYISQVYPRASSFRTPYFQSIFPVDYLQTRAQVAGTQVHQYLAWAKSATSRAEEALTKRGKRLIPPLNRDATPAADVPQAGPAKAEFPALDSSIPRDDRPFLNGGQGEPRSQAFSGQLVYYLFEEGLKRDKSPQEILRQLTFVARFLDYNFADENVPSLREQLLLKVMAAEQASLEINKVLSALETLLVDLDKTFQNLQHQIRSMVASKGGV